MAKVFNDSDMEIPTVDAKYSGNKEQGETLADSSEYLTVKIRYKEPDGNSSKLIEVPVTDKNYSGGVSYDMNWAAAVAEVAMLLRDSEFKGSSSYEEVYESLKMDPEVMTDDYKAQFLYMVRKLMDESESND